MSLHSLSKPRLNSLLEEHPDAVAAAICGLLVFLGWLALHLNWIGLGLLILPTAYVIGGYESAREGITTLFEEHQLDVDLLMIVAALGAAGLGLWRQDYYLIVDGAVLILIFAISSALEGYAMQRTERDIRSLMSLTPDTARVMLHGEEHEIPIDELQVGNEVLVKPGELIPTDAIITEGYSTLNEASITGAQLEMMGKVRAIAFDKTGTLTTGNLQLVQILPATGQSESHVLQIAAALEAYSEHPIGQAIMQAAQRQQLELPPVTSVKAEIGQGISGEIEGKLVLVGKAAFLEEQEISLRAGLEELNVESSNRQQDLSSLKDESLRTYALQLELEGKTLVWVAYAKEVLGIIAIADTPRPSAAATIKRLKQLGIEQIVLLSGDNQRTADSVAQQLGISCVYAGLLPEDKVSVIQRLQRQYQTVAMVGDGINDAPALAQASVGIAMGAAGSDVALETADIVLMADRLEKLEQAIHLGRRSQSIVKQNITFALSFIVLLLITNFTGNITMPLGVIGHEGSTVIVTLSGLRLLKD